jgi:SulP family sulfate permease
MLGRDLVAGATVGVVALPLAMAFGIAVGLEPVHGLITGVVAGFLISFLGGSRYQVGGPTGAFVVIIASVLARHGYEGLVTATIMAGLILVVLSLVRAGRLIEFVPYPVTTGFTAGIGIIILVQQLRDFLGLQIDAPSAEFIERIGQYVRAIDTVHPWSIATGIVTVGGIVTIRRLAPRVPAAAATIALVAVAVKLTGIPAATVADRFGTIPAQLPRLAIPAFNPALIRAVLPDALSIALLAGIESLLSALVADGMTGDRHRSDIELFAQGIANIASVLFGGIPATGAIARTATNIKSGATSPVAGIVHALTLLVLLLVAGPVSGAIPLASLAGVLIVVAWDMSEPHRLVRLLRSPRSDVVVMLATLVLTVLIDLTVAVQVGMVASAFLFMRRMIQVSSLDGGLAAEAVGAGAREPATTEPAHAGIEIYEIDGPFFFGVASRLPDLLVTIERPPRVMILRMRRVPAVDATGLNALETTIRGFHDRGTQVILSGVRDQPERAIVAMGIDAIVGSQNVCRSFEQAMARAEEIVAAATGPAATPCPPQTPSAYRPHSR